MCRIEPVTEKRPDPIRKAAGLPVGIDGGYFVGEGGIAGQGHDRWVGGKYTLPDGVKDFNASPRDQPGLWCQWIPSEDSKSIEWDGGEKFYDYDWLTLFTTHLKRIHFDLDFL